MIAKDNVERLKDWNRSKEAKNSCHHRVGYWARRRRCEEHLASCKREEVFLIEFTKSLEIANDQVPEENYKFWDYMKQLRTRYCFRLKDLNKAIQTYEDGGVR